MDWPREYREVRGFELPLSREGFGAALQRGQGRAVLQAKRFAGACDEDLIIDACIHHQAYDPQCEGDRSAWMMGIVEAAGLQDVACEGVVRRLGEAFREEEYWDAFHVCALAKRMAERGRAAAGEALRAGAERDERLAELLRPAEEVAREPKGERPRAMTAAEVIEKIRAEDPETSPRWPLGAGGRLTEEGRAEVAAAMFAETEPGRLRKYLRALRFRGLGTFDGRLLGLARHADVGVREGAFGVLKHFEHPAVRALTVECAERREFGEGQARLLERNFCAEDGAMLERTLAFPSDVHAFHSLILDLVNGLAEIDSSEVNGILRFVYEYSPCGLCRAGAARGLARRGALPRWMMEECPYDVDEALRDLGG